MGTEKQVRSSPPDGEPEGLPEALALMRLLTHLNAGAMLALCLWLAVTAVTSPVRAAYRAAQSMVPVQGCSCVLVRDEPLPTGGTARAAGTSSG